MAPPDIFGRQYIKEQTICLLIIVVCYNQQAVKQNRPAFISALSIYRIFHAAPQGHNMFTPFGDALHKIESALRISIENAMWCNRLKIPLILITTMCFIITLSVIATRDPHTGAYFEQRLLQMREPGAFVKYGKATPRGGFSCPNVHGKSQASRLTA